MAKLKVWPALDLLEGAPARLYQGAYDQVQRYPHSAAEILQTMHNAGAPRVHLVDLSGAQRGQFAEWAAIDAAVELGLAVEVGGGFRTLDFIQQALDHGATQVVVGTQLIESATFADQLLEQFGPDRIVVGLDVRAQRARIRGWTEAGPDAIELWQQLYALGYRLVNITDIEQDGSLSGIRPEFWAPWSRQNGAIGAGGGIRTTADLDQLSKLAIDRAVVGKAWLEGFIHLEHLDWEDG